jgi:RNA polymerase sigma-70 factor (ECF subfamily)
LVSGSDEEDILCVQRVLMGDTQSFALLVSKYEHRLRSYCRSRLPDSEVDDTVQDIFLKAFKSLAGFRLGRSFPPWIFSIARSCIAGKKHRYRNEEDKRARFVAEYGAVSGVNEGMERLEAEFLLRAVAALPRNYRDVVELYYLAELDTEQTAKTLGIGLEAVKTRLFRARKLLQEMLENGNPVEPQGV